MTKGNIIQAQRDFSAGQIDTEAMRRDNVKLVNAGGRSMLNTYPLSAGGFCRRPGTRRKFNATGRIDKVSPAAGVTFDIAFEAGIFRYRLSGDAYEQVITGCPWTSLQLLDMDWTLYNASIIVVQKTMAPQVLDYNATTGTFALRPFAFRLGPDGLARQPYYRFAGGGITLQPSAITGSITVTASAPVFNAGHVGSIWRWFNRRFQITAFSDSRHVTATCLEVLAITQQIDVASDPSPQGFRAGDAVTMDKSPTVTGLVARIDGPGHDLYVINTGVQSGFFDAGTAGTNDLIGPNAKVDINGTVNTVSPEPGFIWEEAFISPYRGYPGQVSSDRQRLIFCDFPQLTNAVLWSSIGDFEDFNIGASPVDGIFELVPKFERVLHVVGGPDELVFTDKSVFYVPISATNPLVPGSVEFIFIGGIGANSAKPVLTKNTAIYASSEGQRIMGVVHVGGYSRPYDIAHISRFHTSLIKSPKRLGISTGTPAAPGEDIYALNSDGTLVVGRQEEGNDWAGFFPWKCGGTGTFFDVAVFGADVMFRIDRVNAATVTISSCAALDANTKLDDAVDVLDDSGTNAIELEGGGYLTYDFDDTPVQLDGYNLSEFDGSTMSVQLTNRPYASLLAASGGLTGGFARSGAFTVGFPSRLEFIPIVGDIDSGQSYEQRMNRRKINDMAITVQSSGTFMVDRKTFGGHRAGDDFTIPSPLRSATYKPKQLGRTFDPTVTLSQDEPDVLSVVEFALEVTR